MALKLKQRVLVGTGGAAVTVIFLIHMNYLGRLGTISQMEPRIHSSNIHKVSVLRTNGAELPNSRVHLPVMRKDLDLSAYASLEADTKNMTDSRLLELVLKDRHMQKKGAVDGFIRVAHLLESYRNKHRQKAKSTNTSAAEGAGHRGTSSAEGGTSTGGLDPMIVERLSAIVHRMAGSLRKTKKRRGPQLDLYAEDTSTSHLSAWKSFHNHISQYSLYDPTDPTIETLLQDVVSQPIVKLYQHEGGTQLKLVFYLANNARVMWKPRRFPRDTETLPNHFYFNDYERFNAEIAAFHLDRILGLNRVPPTAGRLINMTHDILRLADHKLAKTFFISPAGNVCFHGQCDYYCDTNHAVCGHPDTLEGSVSAFLPSSNIVDRTTWRHPWRRSYSKHRRAMWEGQEGYCDTLRAQPPYNSGRSLLDLTDLAVFDFFTGNMDRHHYETFEDFGNDTYPMILDNGRGFGKARHDELSILAPVYQCCLIRYSTLRRLLAIHQSQTTLSERMRQSMARDKLAPILTERHLVALDRRLNIVLNIVYNCTLNHEARDVIVDDGF